MYCINHKLHNIQYDGYKRALVTGDMVSHRTAMLDTHWGVWSVGVIWQAHRQLLCSTLSCSPILWCNFLWGGGRRKTYEGEGEGRGLGEEEEEKIEREGGKERRE